MERIIATILDKRGKRVVSHHVFDKEAISIGRSYKNDLILHDDFACPEHASIHLREGGFDLEDKDTKNGTKISTEGYIRGKKVPIKSHETIRIGKTKIRFYPSDYVTTDTKAMTLMGLWHDRITNPILVFALMLLSSLSLGWASYLQGSVYFREPSEAVEMFWFYSFGCGLLYIFMAGISAAFEQIRTNRSHFYTYLFSISVCFGLYGLFDAYAMPIISFNFLQFYMLIILTSVVSAFCIFMIFWLSAAVENEKLGVMKTLAALVFSILASVSFNYEAFTFDKVENPLFSTIIVQNMPILTEIKPPGEFLTEAWESF